MALERTRTRRLSARPAGCRALLLVLLLAATASASAGKVYKWVDEHGNVHFGDRPRDNGAEELEIRVRDAQPASPAGGADPMRANIGKVMEEDRLRRQESREEEKQARAKRDRNCQVAKDRLRRMRESTYLYDIDNDGKRRILSHQERAAAEQRVLDQVSQYCG